VYRRRLEALITYSPKESFKDVIFYGCEVIFQTRIEPQLEDGLKYILHDDELIGKFVQVVDHIHILETANAMFSIHIVEPAFNSLDGFDPTELLPSVSHSINMLKNYLTAPPYCC
tara:strand:- start:114 stop:458 length:345 start_codon:yes stop_codon:yes gene_type:complete